MTKKFLFYILSCFFATAALADDTIVLCENNYYVNKNISYSPYNPGLPSFFAALGSNNTIAKNSVVEVSLYNAYLNALRTYRMLKTSVASSVISTCIKCPGSGTISGKSTCTIKTDKIECELKTRDDCTITLNRKDKTGVFYYNNIESCVYSPTTTTTNATNTSGNSSSGTSSTTTSTGSNATTSTGSDIAAAAAAVAAAAAAAAAAGNAHSAAAAVH